MENIKICNRNRQNIQKLYDLTYKTETINVHVHKSHFSEAGIFVCKIYFFFIT